MSVTRKDREIALSRWAGETLRDQGRDPGESFGIEPASDDASFRRYFRGCALDKDAAETSYIFVDAPPALEDSRPFIEVARLLHEAGLNAPVIHAADIDQGFLMLSDLGDDLYLDVLAAQEEDRIHSLYDDALAAIVSMQQRIDAADLPAYDEALLRQEMNLFVDWFLPKQLLVETTPTERQLIEDVFRRLVENAVSQPQAFVHRDYHSRNLMVLNAGNPGIIDFQDAVRGPVTYDLVSLMKDCYHRFSPDAVADAVDQFYQLALNAGLIEPVGREAFTRWFDLMGMQRHIKVAGIFSRLNLRDGKPGFLADIPLVLDYIVEVCERYPELSAFRTLLDERVLPRMNLLVADP